MKLLSSHALMAISYKLLSLRCLIFLLPTRELVLYKAPDAIKFYFGFARQFDASLKLAKDLMEVGCQKQEVEFFTVFANRFKAQVDTAISGKCPPLAEHVVTVIIKLYLR